MALKQLVHLIKQVISQTVELSTTGALHLNPFAWLSCLRCHRSTFTSICKFKYLLSTQRRLSMEYENIIWKNDVTTSKRICETRCSYDCNAATTLPVYDFVRWHNVAITSLFNVASLSTDVCKTFISNELITFIQPFVRRCDYTILFAGYTRCLFDETSQSRNLWPFLWIA